MQSQHFGPPPARAFVPDCWLENGDAIEATDRTLQVLHCPDHTPGCIVSFSAEDRVTIVDNVLFAKPIGYTDFPCGNHADLINVIRAKLWSLGNGVTSVPGHEPVSTFGDERASNPYVTNYLSANEDSA